MEHLIFVVLVVAAFAVAGYMHRDKLRGIFDKKPKPEPEPMTGTRVPAITVPTAGPSAGALATERRILEAIAFLRERKADLFNGWLEVYFQHPGGPAVLQVVGVSGQPLVKASDSFSGPSGLVSTVANRDLFNNVHEAFRGKLPAGQYHYRFESAARGRVGAQYQATN